jgi:hypothetical protein
LLTKVYRYLFGLPLFVRYLLNAVIGISVFLLLLNAFPFVMRMLHKISWQIPLIAEFMGISVGLINFLSLNAFVPLLVWVMTIGFPRFIDFFCRCLLHFVDKSPKVKPIPEGVKLDTAFRRWKYKVSYDMFFLFLTLVQLFFGLFLLVGNVFFIRMFLRWLGMID